jgi:hypothetical protein
MHAGTNAMSVRDQDTEAVDLAHSGGYRCVATDDSGRHESSLERLKRAEAEAIAEFEDLRARVDQRRH